MMRVKAVEGRMLPWADPDGTVVSGRYVARTRVRSEDRTKVSFDATPGGENVPETSYYHRALRAGDIVLAVEDLVAPLVAPLSAEIPAVPVAEAEARPLAITDEERERLPRLEAPNSKESE